MPNKPRIDVGDVVYHVHNRANGRQPLFESDEEYREFENILDEAKSDVVDMRILAYCLMPNHFHLILFPREDQDLTRFMRWVTATHAKRWRAHRQSTGEGHVYQGKFRSFPIESNDYFLTACRYVERNPLRAKLVDDALEWRWSSLWRREYGSKKQKKLLTEWPVDVSENYLTWVNDFVTPGEIEDVRTALKCGTPFGHAEWKKKFNSNE
jgi:putative transposase